MNKTSIEWCRTYQPDGSFVEGHTVNPIRFRPYGSQRTVTMCQKISPGCLNCYAASIVRRFWPRDANGRFAGYTAQGLLSGEFVVDEKQLLSVLKHKNPTRIFWGDMTDLFQDGITDAMLDRCMAVCALTPHITHMFLTKRPARMLQWFTKHHNTCHPGAKEMAFGYAQNLPGYDAESSKWWKMAANAFDVWPLPNVWLGVSTESQQYADERIPLLLETPAAVRFISAEPLLGPIDLSILPRPFKFHQSPYGWERWLARHLHWAIAGGESGPGARQMNAAWARSLRDQCVTAGIPYFFKQWGAWVPTSDPKIAQARGVPFETCMDYVGKKNAGALLDGVEYRQFPETRP